MLSHIVSGLPETAINIMFNRAAVLRSEGKELLNFSIGEPDFDTPDHIAEAGIQAIRKGYTRYTESDGSHAMKQAVLQKILRDNRLTYTPEELVISPGAKILLGASFQVVLDPEDEVILPAPLWGPNTGMVCAVGAVPVIVQTTETNFKLTPETLEAAITPKTRLLLLCSPSNPTGAVYNRDELLALSHVLRKYPNVLIAYDIIYEHILFTEAPFVTLPEVAPDLRERTLLINGVSKCYSMTGWRIGFGAGPVWWMNGLRALFSQSSGDPSSISQHAAIAALTGPQDLLEDRRKIYNSRRNSALEGLQAISGIEVTPPDGAFYVFPNCAGLIGKTRPDGAVITSSFDLANWFMEYGVVVVPGSGFNCDPYFRMSIANSEDIFSEGLRRIAKAIDELKG